MSQSSNPELVYPDPSMMLQAATGTKVWSEYALLTNALGSGWKRPTADSAPDGVPLRKINALTLGGRYPLDFGALMQRGIAVARLTGLTGTTIESMGSPKGGINRTAFEITAAATPEEYDVVVIDRAASYYPKEYARVIGESMLPQTVLHVTGYPYCYPLTPKEEQNICADWEDEFGITHFSGISGGKTKADAIAEVLEDVPVVERPELPDVQIVVRMNYFGFPDQ